MRMMWTGFLRNLYPFRLGKTFGCLSREISCSTICCPKHGESFMQNSENGRRTNFTTALSFLQHATRDRCNHGCACYRISLIRKVAAMKQGDIKDQRRRAVITAWVLGTVAIAIFAAFVLSGIRGA